MTKNKNIQGNKMNFFVFIFVAIFFIISTAIGADWTDPTVDPPGGNVEAPLNQGSISQYKTGKLTIGSSTIDENYVLNVVGKSSFSGNILQATGGVLINTQPITISGVVMSMDEGASLNINKGYINIYNNEAGSYGIFSQMTEGSLLGVSAFDYSDAPLSPDDPAPISIYGYSENNIGVRGGSLVGTGVLGVSDSGIAIWGSSPLFSGKFDGPAVFLKYGDSGYGVMIEGGNIRIGANDPSARTGDLYVSNGISTVSRSESVGNSPVYANNTIVTDSLCLGAASNIGYQGIDANGNPVGASCRKIWPGPQDENSFIWNADYNPNLVNPNTYQTGSIRINGTINNTISFNNNDVNISGDLFVLEDTFNVGGTLTADTGVVVNGGIVLSSGDLDVRDNRIKGLPTPGTGAEYNTDAVPKSYVDNLVGGDTSYWEIGSSGFLQPRTGLGERGLKIISGQVGIGTADPNKNLHIYSTVGDNAEIDIQSVAGTNNHWGIYNNRSDNTLKFWRGSDVLTLQQDGYIKVNGLANISGNRCLYVDASGVVRAKTEDCGSGTGTTPDLVTIACNTDGEESNPDKAIKIGNSSYIYDSSCYLGSNKLQITSGEKIDINATDELGLKVNNNYGIKISSGSMLISTPNGGSNSILISSGINSGSLTSEAISLKTNQTLGNLDELLQIKNNLTDLVTILGSGNVGVGVISPSGKLIVKGVGTGNGIGLQTQNSSGVALFTTLDNGNVGIGTISPEKNLHIKTNSANVNAEIDIQSFTSPKWGIYQDDNTDDLRFWNVDNRMTITDDGKVGIGTTNPTAKLELNGQIKITGGSPGLGKVLTSDANGLATWTTASGMPTASTGQTAYYNGTTWVASGNIYNNNGNVGIGTTAPSTKLEVNGDIKAQNLYINNNGSFLGKVEADGVCDSNNGDCLGGPLLKVGGISCVNAERALQYSHMTWSGCTINASYESISVSGYDTYYDPRIKNIFAPTYEDPAYGTNGLFYIHGDYNTINASALRFCAQLGYTGVKYPVTWVAINFNPNNDSVYVVYWSGTSWKIKTINTSDIEKKIISSISCF